MADLNAGNERLLPDSVDVVIAGGGMVGVAVAAALAPSGLSIAVVEPRELAPEAYLPFVLHENQAGMDSRVSALTPVSEQILSNLGAWDVIQSLRLTPYREMQVWDGEGTASIHFDATTVYRQHLGHIVENRVILAGLYEAARQFENIHWLNPTTIQSISNAQLDDGGRWYRELRLSNEHVLSARLVVAADGARSRTRQLAGLAITEWDYEHQAVVTTVRTEESHQHTAWQRFTEDGPLAFLPLPDTSEGEHQSSIVWSTSPDHAAALLTMDDAEFCHALTMAFEGRLGRVIATDARQKFSLVQRHAKAYVDTGVALVGDAAHSIHPLAGQGVNLGFMDVAVLAEEIIDAAGKSIDYANPDWLTRYQRRRQGEVWKVMATMAGLKHLYGDIPAPLQWVRNMGLSQVDRLAPIKRIISQQAMGFSADLPKIARS